VQKKSLTLDVINECTCYDYYINFMIGLYRNKIFLECNYYIIAMFFLIVKIT